MTEWQSAGFIPHIGPNYSEDAYFANGPNREYRPYGQVCLSYTPYYAALLPEITVHCSIGSLGISALTMCMRSTDWLKFPSVAMTLVRTRLYTCFISELVWNSARFTF